MHKVAAKQTSGLEEVTNKAFFLQTYRTDVDVSSDQVILMTSKLNVIEAVETGTSRHK